MTKPLSIHDLHHRELESNRTGEKYSLSAVLTEALGFNDVFVHHDIIPPGRRASGPHAHSEREEMLLVLEGTVTAVLGDKSQVLKPGDFIGFLPGPENIHFVRNDGDQPACILVIASNPTHDEVIQK